MQFSKIEDMQAAATTPTHSDHFPKQEKREHTAPSNQITSDYAMIRN